MIKTFYWKNNTLFILNQLCLPLKKEYIPCTTSRAVSRCIRDMVVRGAPAIGVAAAYGLVLSVPRQGASNNIVSVFNAARRMLLEARPTAVNLRWALDEMARVFKRVQRNSGAIRSELLSAAHTLYRKDVEANKAIGRYGAGLLKKNSIVLTHCNAGALATAGWGTALGIIRTGFLQGKVRKVYVDETRPYFQGARLTAWELQQEHIPFNLITDSMAGHLMKTDRIDAVIVGADRITAAGDAANKIGTYSLAVLARYHTIPFYVAAPVSTFDMTITSGNDIPIEERSAHEVTHVGSIRIAPRGVKVRHPAFDVTPAELISAIITERGVIRRPNKNNVERMLKS